MWRGLLLDGYHERHSKRYLNLNTDSIDGRNMKSVTELKKEIRKARESLSRLEARYVRAHTRVSKYGERQRVEQAKRELLKRFPDMTFNNADERILRLVGTLPYIPLSKEKQEIARVIAAKQQCAR